MLVVLGLLVGGVLAGQSLIHAAELRSIIKEYDRYRTATLSFRDKYFALPGDLPNATQFWGEVAAGVACGNTPSTGKATCNGNGNGQIYYNNIPMVYSSPEMDRFWQHLANAEMIEGTYTGTTAALPHRPVNKMNGGSDWSVLYLPQSLLSMSVPNYMFVGNYEHSLFLNNHFTGGSFLNSGLEASDLWNIDTKLDDGKPGMGKMVVIANMPAHVNTLPLTSCATSSAVSTAEYLQTSTGNVCRPLFRQQF